MASFQGSRLEGVCVIGIHAPHVNASYISVSVQVSHTQCMQVVSMCIHKVHVNAWCARLVCMHFAYDAYMCEKYVCVCA